MNISLETRVLDTSRNPLDEVISKLRERFEHTKRVNPLGFMDAFELRLDLTLAEIAQELGYYMLQNDGVYIITDSPTGYKATIDAQAS